jgi:D-glycerate 3-kinase
LLARSWRDVKQPFFVGLSGAQGTGKTTLARLLETACVAVGRRVGILALDDYYRTRAERVELAGRVHPLFATRGPPGTHDVERLRRDLLALARPGEVEVPIFDKGCDDRVGARRLSGPFDLIALEGWCVGALPEDEASLGSPCNRLERDEDPAGVWRRASNEALRSGYAALFAELDEIVYLRAPDLECVRRWRLDQEAERPAAQRLNADAIDRFVAHYERISLAMMATLSGRVAFTIDLGPDHSIERVRRGEGQTQPSR